MIEGIGKDEEEMTKEEVEKETITIGIKEMTITEVAEEKNTIGEIMVIEAIKEVIIIRVTIVKEIPKTLN